VWLFFIAHVSLYSFSSITSLLQLEDVERRPGAGGLFPSWLHGHGVLIIPTTTASAIMEGNSSQKAIGGSQKKGTNNKRTCSHANAPHDKNSKKKRADEKRTPRSGRRECFPSLPASSPGSHFISPITANGSGSPIHWAPGAVQTGSVLLGNTAHKWRAIVPNLITEAITLTGHYTARQHLVTNPRQELPTRALIPQYSPFPTLPGNCLWKDECIQ